MPAPPQSPWLSTPPPRPGASYFEIMALRENLTKRPPFMPPSQSAALQETDVGHRHHSFGQAQEMPCRVDFSAEHGQRLDEGIGVPRLSGLSTRDRRTQKAYDSLDSPQTRESDFAVSPLWAESRGK